MNKEEILEKSRKENSLVLKNRLKEIRSEQELSQSKLAEMVGVSRQTINAIEKGDYNPTINLCIAICKTLNKTLDQLFWEE